MSHNPFLLATKSWKSRFTVKTQEYGLMWTQLYVYVCYSTAIMFPIQGDGDGSSSQRLCPPTYAQGHSKLSLDYTVELAVCLMLSFPRRAGSTCSQLSSTLASAAAAAAADISLGEILAFPPLYFQGKCMCCWPTLFPFFLYTAMLSTAANDASWKLAMFYSKIDDFHDCVACKRIDKCPCPFMQQNNICGKLSV